MWIKALERGWSIVMNKPIWSYSLVEEANINQIKTQSKFMFTMNGP